ncbi:MAG: pantetheine-phosphate adenylyltransferase [Peptoniphilaceae bacterium]|nr:pantetheine-phosphate adenylyltransferase [Peptoniphilaceae bacterium]MDD7382856.1 pantetheine-phosphate adenylyltransferase [Peptoniphilaceae bacterium]MDY3738185.1 pantetheine-phosphate adenylyltransferase [Peptoniphilaceae bacterium]
MKVLYPGSFDPITNGHLDIIERASKKFDNLVVAVLVNSEKKTLFTLDERVKLIYENIKQLKINNVTIESFEGLTANYAKNNNIDFIIRGIRGFNDYEYEKQIALINSKLTDGLETLFMLSDIRFSFVSSSIVKEIASYGGDISPYVTKCVEKALKMKYFSEK